MRSVADPVKDEIVVRNSRWKLPLMLLLCVLIVLVAVFGPESFGLIPKPGWQFAVWPGAVFFGACGVVISRRLFDSTPEIVISRSGISMRQWSKERIPWAAIRACRIERVQIRWPAYNRLVCLCLRDPKAYPRTTWRGRFFGRGWNLGYGDITMMTSGLDHGIEDIWEAIERFAPSQVELDRSQL
jgi:hypothetical protein